MNVFHKYCCGGNSKEYQIKREGEKQEAEAGAVMEATDSKKEQDGVMRTFWYPFALAH